MISDHEVQPYERRGMLVTLFEDKAAAAAQRVVCSDVVPLGVNADGYLVPRR